MPRTPLVLAAALATGAVLSLTAGVADAAQPVTFSITGGGLSISAPSTPVTLAVNGGSTQASGQLGATTVTDLRSVFLGSYTVTMSASAFDHDGPNDGDYAIPASNVTAYSDGLTGSSGVIVAVVSTALFPASVGNPSGATLMAGTAQIGATTATYNPTLQVAIPSTALAGTYTGSVTQTVS
jgi:hypothetical protein